MLYVIVYVFGVASALSVVPVRLELHCIDTVWVLVVGVKPNSIHAVLVHLFHVYPSLTVALIVTDFHHLYVHAPLTLLIHVHLFNVNPKVFLLYQTQYLLLSAVNIWFVVFTVVVLVVGCPTLHHTKISHRSGFDHIFS